MTAKGKKALRMFNIGFDTADIADRMGLPEAVICDAIYEARQERKQKKEEKTTCKQRQPQ